MNEKLVTQKKEPIDIFLFLEKINFFRDVLEKWPAETMGERSGKEIHYRAVSWRREQRVLAPSYIRRLPVPDLQGNQVLYLKVGDIVWIAAERQYLRLHTSERSFLTRGPGLTIKSLVRRLNPAHFIRVHRSYIVNLEQVSAVRFVKPEKRLAILASGHEVPVSSSYWRQLEVALVGGSID